MRRPDLAQLLGNITALRMLTCPKHLHRYVDEFSGRHNVRPLDTIDQMAAIVRRAAGKRLTYEQLIS